jgi:hypothetical protein
MINIIIQKKMRVVVFFGLLSTLIEYLTIRIYHVHNRSDQDEDVFCTINILNTLTKSEKRWKLDRQLQSFLIFLEILVRRLPSILADLVNSKTNFSDDLQLYIFMFESNYESIFDEAHDSVQFFDDCSKFLYLLKLLKTEYESERLIECHVIIHYLIDFSKNLYIFSIIFNDFIFPHMFHLLHYSYSSKKANKIWNMEMKRLSSAINTFSAFDKKII